MSSLQNCLIPNYINMEEIHIKDIIDIENNSYGYPWSEKIFNDCLKNNYFCRVLILDNILIWFLISSIIQDECHIMNLCVDIKYRGSGYGRFMLNKLHNEIKNHNFKIVFLECRPSNKSAMSLYKSEGYNEVGIRRNYYPAPNGYEDAIMLAKNVEK